MEDFPTQEITIYHKNEKIWDRYCVKASYRNTSILNRNKSVDDEIKSTPLTELSAKYGTENVHKVTSIDKFIFDDEDLPNHIKIGAI